MSPALAELAVCEETVQQRRTRRPCDRPGRGVTLAQLLESVHQGAADCPLCGAEMARNLLDAECRGCGTRVS